MNPKDIEALYLTPEEAATYLGVNKSRVRQLALAGHVVKLKGGVYDRASIEAYRDKRGDKRGGPYPK